MCDRSTVTTFADGFGFGVAVFLLGGFGCCCPGFLILMGAVLDLEHNRSNEWFRTHGQVQQAVVVDKKISYDRQQTNHLITYEVAGWEPRTEGVASDMYNALAVGDLLEVWVAGERSRIVQEDSYLLRFFGPLVVVPMISLILLIWVYRRQQQKGCTRIQEVVKVTRAGPSALLRGDEQRSSTEHGG